MYFQSKLPLIYWSECILHATYLINRTPCKLLGKISPFEKLFNTKHDYSNLKSFGSLAFVSTLNSQRTKFAPRAKACVFIGYPPGMKAFKFIDLETKQIFSSRDSIFHEDIFPFTQITDSESVNPFPFHTIPAVFDPDLDDDTELFNTISNDHSSFSDHSNEIVPNDHSNEPSQSSESSKSTPEPPISSRPQRTKSKPTYLQDYHCHLIQNETLPTNARYPISSSVDYSKLSSTQKAFSLAISAETEPKNYKEASLSKEWIGAMTDELNALEVNNTWNVVPLPADRKALGCKWVFKIKRRADGSIERHKARLVAKGFNQQEGIDFLDTFSPVAKLVTVKLLLALAA